MPVPVPSFIEGPRGPLFAINWAPREETKGTVLCVPPFAEEMNRCRRTFTEFCMRAAAMGWSAWQFDLYGTGDSSGDFADATWEGWGEDLNLIAERVAVSGPLVVLAMRAGALIATGWLASGGHCDTLLLWQPVPSGKQHLQQFLRLRVMASRFEGVNESLKELLAEIDEKGEVEVGGYRIPAAVAKGMMGTDLAALVPSGTGRVSIFEAAAAAPEKASKPLERVLTQWRTAGLDCTWHGLADAQCWASQETVISWDLISAGLSLLEQMYPTAVEVAGAVK